MSGLNNEHYQDWVAEEWVGEDPAADTDATPHWNKYQWVGDGGHGRPRPRNAEQMPEGERGMSGLRHTPPAAHWASAS
jgi:hypothetical protein